MIDWAMTSKNRRFKCRRISLEVVGGLYHFLDMVGRYLYFTKTPDPCKKLQDITFLELLHNSYIKLTEVVGISFWKRYNIVTLKI